MRSLPYQHNNGFRQNVLIFENQRETKSGGINHKEIRSAVRAWASTCRSREFVAAQIVKEWHANGGKGLDIPTDPYLQMQKIFRWIDSDTKYSTENIRLLTPAILSVLPLEFRGRLVGEDDFMTRIAAMEKEISEAKQAVMLNAPRHQKLKEMSEGIVSMFRVEPDLAGPLVAMVTTMLGAL